MDRLRVSPFGGRDGGLNSAEMLDVCASCMMGHLFLM
jgi:hypothetical protein